MITVWKQEKRGTYRGTLGSPRKGQRITFRSPKVATSDAKTVNREHIYYTLIVSESTDLYISKHIIDKEKYFLKCQFVSYPEFMLRIVAFS